MYIQYRFLLQIVLLLLIFLFPSCISKKIPQSMEQKQNKKSNLEDMWQAENFKKLTEEEQLTLADKLLNENFLLAKKILLSEDEDSWMLKIPLLRVLKDKKDYRFTDVLLELLQKYHQHPLLREVVIIYAKEYPVRFIEAFNNHKEVQELLIPIFGESKNLSYVTILIESLASTELKNYALTALQKLTYQGFKTQSDWQKWWNNNRYRTREEILSESIQNLSSENTKLRDKLQHLWKELIKNEIGSIEMLMKQKEISNTEHRRDYETNVISHFSNLFSLITDRTIQIEIQNYDFMFNTYETITNLFKKMSETSKNKIAPILATFFERIVGDNLPDTPQFDCFQSILTKFYFSLTLNLLKDWFSCTEGIKFAQENLLTLCKAYRYISKLFDLETKYSCEQKITQIININDTPWYNKNINLLTQIPVKLNVIDIIAKFQSRELIDSFIEVLENPNEQIEVKVKIIQSLSSVSDQRVFNYLANIIETFQETDNKLKEVAIVALGNIRKKESLKLLLNTLAKTKNKTMMWLIINSLGNLRYKTAEKWVIPYLNTKYQDIQEVAIETLSKLNSDVVVPSLLYLLTKSTNQRLTALILENLSKVMNPYIFSKLLNIYANSDLKSILPILDKQINTNITYFYIFIKFLIDNYRKVVTNNNILDLTKLITTTISKNYALLNPQETLQYAIELTNRLETDKLFEPLIQIHEILLKYYLDQCYKYVIDLYITNQTYREKVTLSKNITNDVKNRLFLDYASKLSDSKDCQTLEKLVEEKLKTMKDEESTQDFKNKITQLLTNCKK